MESCRKQRVTGRRGENEQPPAKISVLRNFAGCEFSHSAKFRRLQKIRRITTFSKFSDKI